MIDISHVWWVVFFFVSFLTIYLFYLYLKDRNKRKLVFTIGFLISIPAFFLLSNGLITLDSSEASVLWYNIFTISSLPFLFAVFIAAHENVLKVKNYDKIFNIFVLFSIICLVIMFLPFKLAIIPNIVRSIISFEVLAVTLYMYIKTRRIENLYFVLYIITAMAAGMGFSLDYGYFSSFAFIIGYIFIGLLFIQPTTSQHSSKNLKNYFSLEEELKTAEQKYKQLFNAIPDAISILSSDGTIVDLNETVAHNFSVSKDEMIGKNIHEFLPVDVDKQRTSAGLKALQSGKIQKDEDKRGESYFNNLYVPIETSGKQKNLMVISRNITNEKKLEDERKKQLHDLRDTELATLNIMEDMQETVENLEKARNEILAKNKEIESARLELADLNMNLEQKVEERTKEVNQLLKQKDAFIDQLGHDLKHPLGPFINLLPLLKKGETDEKKQKIIDVLQRNVSYMKRLVIRTVKLAKLNAPSTTFDFKRIHFNELIEQIIEKNTSLFEQHHIEIKKHIENDVFLNADELQIEEVLENLFSNAMKYGAENGSITITAEKQDEQTALISISDTGKGMNQEQLTLVFQEFYKADESRHDFNDTGLGLSICKRIIEKHNGAIWAESEGLDKGTTFFFTLPLANKKQDEKKLEA